MAVRIAAVLALLCGGIGGWTAACAQLPPVPVPAENPITEAKRVLGKVLFWDEQLSSDNTVACGTCHRPASGGADPRVGRHTGTDERTVDDIWGSPGVVAMNEAGETLEHPMFGREPQVTTRIAPSNFGALWATEQFWDGRAGSEFLDPLTGEVAIASGGALENQAHRPLVQPRRDDAAGPDLGRSDREARGRTAVSAGPKPPSRMSPLPSMRTRTTRRCSRLAFDDPEITPVRIAFAIATYERTLVADQTPWDRYMAGDETALTEQAAYGWRTFQRLHCVNCHEPPLFTINDFLNIGLRLR